MIVGCELQGPEFNDEQDRVPKDINQRTENRELVKSFYPTNQCENSENWGHVKH